jgi:hypothetical protein
MVWEDRNLPHSVWAQLSQTAATHGSRNAVTFQMFSGDKDPFENADMAQLQGKVAQTANLFRDLGIGSTTWLCFYPMRWKPCCPISARVAGIVNPINPLLDADQIGAILRETNAKVW